MTLRDLISVFSNNTKLQINNNDRILFKGKIGESRKVDKSNLEIVWCEIKDDVLLIEVEY